MRLHSLTVQAFGPFAGRHEVDLDALSGAGLFLLHGQTGAGKTSLLDAVCFALYGQVPGARSGAGVVALRSHHAAADVAPEVVLDLTIGGRRFEVTRSPSWERPKRRGGGHTTAQAHMQLKEHVDGEWVARSTRADEASQLLTDVLGMGREQFTRVVMLPQGDFAAFLRSGERERRELLQRLFGTDRFEDVERWLAARSTDLRRQVEAHHSRVRVLGARAQQAALSIGGAARDPDDEPGQAQQPDAVDDVHHVRGWVAGQRDRAESVREAALAAVAGARAHASSAREVALAAGARVVRAGELARLRAREAELVEQAPEVAEQARRVVLGRRAATLSAHVAGAERGRLDVEGCRRSVAAALDDLARHDAQLVDLVDRAQMGDTGAGTGATAGAEVSDDTIDLRERALALHGEAGRLVELVRLEVETGERTGQASAAAAHATARWGAAQAAQERSRELSRALASLTATVAGEREIAATLESCRAQASRAGDVAAAARRAAELEEEVAQAARTDHEATDAHQDAREAELRVRAQRLAGMAAELAADLVPGSACAVCGAREHPRPATRGPADPVVDADAEQEASARTALALTRRTRAATALSDRRGDLAAARAASAGTAPSVADAAHSAAQSALSSAQAAAAAAVSGAGEAATLEAELVDVRDEAERAADESARSAARAQELADRVREDTARLAGELGGDSSLAARRQRVSSAAGALDALVQAQAAQRSAAQAADASTAQLQAAAREAGFTDPGQAIAAQLSSTVLEELDEQVAEHVGALAGVRERLAESDMLTAAEDTSADEQELAARATVAEQAHAQAQAAVEAAVADQRQAQAALTDLTGLLAELATEDRDSADLRERERAAGGLAEAASGANPRRMALSSYVLAARLEQVCQAASARLAAMSDQRYTLVHSDALARHGARSGLGLRVVDAWTGQHRDPASLSGGETFLASLALALGLADVVQFEGGGTPIETLFVDEGFGTLDEETLEEVMAVLDQLRAGGRVVGLVSHVAELRTRIATRLEVVKDRAGSHLEVVLG